MSTIPSVGGPAGAGQADPAEETSAPPEAPPPSAPERGTLASFVHSADVGASTLMDRLRTFEQGVEERVGEGVDAARTGLQHLEDAARPVIAGAERKLEDLAAPLLDKAKAAAGKWLDLLDTEKQVSQLAHD